MSVRYAASELPLRVLFQQPPPELIMTVSVSISSPVTFPSDPRTMPSTASALRITRTSQPCSSSHLFHFALRTALPFSLVGRHSHDYYWNSVTLGLASLRQSHVPSPGNVLERLRFPIHPLQ